MLDYAQVEAVLSRCGLGYIGHHDQLVVFASPVRHYSGEPIIVDMGEERISEQRLSDTLVAQGIPLAIVEDALMATRQNPPPPA